MQTAAQRERAGIFAGRRSQTLMAVLGAAALLVASWLMTGSAPPPADAGVSTTPPPLALPSDTGERSPLALAAVQLASGNLRSARTAFSDVVAEHPDEPAGQVGLILAQWDGAGPLAVERDLSQLAREYPDSALVALHLGMTRSLVRNHRGARSAFADAVALGQQAGDRTSLRMAALADDLLHPGSFRGYMPVLVAPSQVPTAERARLRQLLRAVEHQDRAAARRTATALAKSRDPSAQIAAAAAMFDKSDPSSTAIRLGELADDSVEMPADAALAQLHQGLALLWAGEERRPGCRILSAVAASASAGRAPRLAAPIRAELCT